MPSHHCLGSDDHNGVQHGRAQPINPNEDQPIEKRQPRPRWHPAAQDVQLVSENHDLSFKSSFGPELCDNQARQELQTIDHPASRYPIRGLKPLRMKFAVGLLNLHLKTGAPDDPRGHQPAAAADDRGHDRPQLHLGDSAYLYPRGQEPHRLPRPIARMATAAPMSPPPCPPPTRFGGCAAPDNAVAMPLSTLTTNNPGTSTTAERPERSKRAVSLRA
jgi:hypothetical protein